MTRGPRATAALLSAARRPHRSALPGSRRRAGRGAHRARRITLRRRRGVGAAADARSAICAGARPRPPRAPTAGGATLRHCADARHPVDATPAPPGGTFTLPVPACCSPARLAMAPRRAALAGALLVLLAPAAAGPLWDYVHAVDPTYGWTLAGFNHTEPGWRGVLLVRRAWWWRLSRVAAARACSARLRARLFRRLHRRQRAATRSVVLCCRVLRACLDRRRRTPRWILHVRLPRAPSAPPPEPHVGHVDDARRQHALRVVAPALYHHPDERQQGAPRRRLGAPPA